MKTKNDVKKISQEYNELPKEFQKLKKGSMVFIMKHGNADAAINGMGLIARVTLDSIVNKAVLVLDSKGISIPEGHVFIGIPRLKGLGNAYVHVSADGKIVIGSMSSQLIK